MASVDALLAEHPHIRDALDDRALGALASCEESRSLEILEDLVHKGDVRNYSAFVSSALAKFPQRRTRSSEVDDFLEQNPEVKSGLDEKAVERLRDANPGRALEIVQELAQKTDVNNPSAFVTKALTSFPNPRGSKTAVEDALTANPEIVKQLDDNALAKLREGEPARAVEIIEDIAGKIAQGEEIRNMSAFVATALKNFPHKRTGATTVPWQQQQQPVYMTMQPSNTRSSQRSLEKILATMPHLNLDDRAMQALRQGNADRAIEIVQEIASKGDVSNPSAFVTKAMFSHPQPRGGGNGGGAIVMGGLMNAPRSASLESTLRRNPRIRDELDDKAMSMLKSADPGRAVEIIEEIASKGDVRNISAFVSKSINAHPTMRGSRDDGRAGTMMQQMQQMQLAMQMQLSGRQQTHVGGPGGGRRDNTVSKCLRRHRHVMDALDDRALDELEGHEDPSRAVEIIEDLAAKGDVRNPSAFVAKSLRDFPRARGGHGGGGGGYGGFGLSGGGGGGSGSAQLEAALRRHPLEGQIDDRALAALRSADVSRALEILDEMSMKGDIHNPSAFVSKALQSYPHKRGSHDMNNSGYTPMPAKRARTDGDDSFPGLGLDDRAQRQLAEADPDRVAEILEELTQKGSEVRNPSAFVSKALQQYPTARGRRSGGDGLM